MKKTILVGVDGSDCCARAVAFATDRARSANARIVLAYVIEWSRYSFNTPEENEERHKRREEEIERAQQHVLAPLMKSVDVEVEGIVRHGHVAETLAALVEECNADQVVIGRIGQSSLKTLLFGSVAATLVQISPVPVTVVP